VSSDTPDPPRYRDAVTTHRGTDGEQADKRAATPSVEPLDVDGVRAVAVGTVLWAVALVVLLPLHASLREDGRLWWIGTCACGVLLGLAGLVYLRRRRAALTRRAPAVPNVAKVARTEP